MFLAKQFIIALLLASTAFSSFSETKGRPGDNHGSKITVMTQNMDAGTDFKFLVPLANSPSSPSLAEIVSAATKTYGEVLKSDIPGRAKKLAYIIARTQPDFISLQEVTRWQTFSEDGTTTGLYDQLELLLKSLKKLNHPYQVAIDQSLSQGQLPVDPALINRPEDAARLVSFTDSDVIIVRADLKKANIQLLNREKHKYSVLLPFPLLQDSLSYRGWLAVDAKVRGNTLRVVNTHLETVIPGIDATALIQQAQAIELVSALQNVNSPVVIAGDFNADAEFAKIGPDQTETPNIMLGAGYTDTWEEKFPNNPGFTWPLFLEDPLLPNPVGPFERIDLIYERGLDTVSVHRVGYLKQHFPSDHLGLMTTLQFSNKHELPH
jgi:endonuclease/exonuclease/phosphatase family metal-dependent hydrolase